MDEPNKKEFERLIFEGMRNSYRNAFSFSGEITTTIKPEYLVTVNIAQSINEINKHNSNIIIIKLEESTWSFASSCVPLFSNPNSLFNNHIREMQDSQKRPGRVDIATYREVGSFDKRPFAVIEVKGFVKYVSTIYLDIIRNLEFFGISDKNTGSSRLEQSYMVFLHKHEGCIFERQKQDGILELKKTYEQYLLQLNSFIPKSLQWRIEADTIAKNLLDDSTDISEEEGEYRSQEAYHYIGVVIVLEKRENSNE